MKRNNEIPSHHGSENKVRAFGIPRKNSLVA